MVWGDKDSHGKKVAEDTENIGEILGFALDATAILNPTDVKLQLTTPCPNSKLNPYN